MAPSQKYTMEGQVAVFRPMPQARHFAQRDESILSNLYVLSDTLGLSEVVIGQITQRDAADSFEIGEVCACGTAGCRGSPDTTLVGFLDLLKPPLEIPKCLL